MKQWAKKTSGFSTKQVGNFQEYKYLLTKNKHALGLKRRLFQGAA